MARHGNFAWLSHVMFRRSLSSNSPFNTGVNNYYTVLKITPNATQEEIKKAYYKLSKLYHPDTNKSEQAHDHFTSINEAYDTLGNLGNRKRYDRGLAMHHSPSMKTKQQPQRTMTQQFQGKRIVYDFDDWTQKYHEEARKRRKRHTVNRKEYETRHTFNETEVFNRNIIFTAVLILIGVVAIANGKNRFL